MLTTTTRTEPALKSIEPPPIVAGTTEAKPAPPQADAQPAHWGDGIALRLWALGFLLLFTLLVLEAIGDLFRR